MINYKEATILFVDDEELTRKYFQRNFQSTFTILTAADAGEARELLQTHSSDIGVLVTDQRMPGETGVQLLEYARKHHPHILRLLITAYADINDTIAAINNGSIYKYISKPYEEFEVELVLKRALEFYLIQKERNALLREKFGAVHRTLLTERILSMGVLAAGISHHMRNSLTAVRAFLDLAPKKLAEEKQNAERINDPMFWKEMVEVAQTQVEKIVDFLNDIECYAEIPARQFKDRVAFPELLQKSVHQASPLLEKAGLQIELGTLPETTLTIDQPLLEKAVTLMFEERSRGIGRPGKISLKAREVAPSDSLPAHLDISVSDPGISLEDDEMLPLFDPFKIDPSQPSEIGVHLLGAFFLIYHHGGLFHLNSRGTQGLEFSICLPLDANTPLQPSTENSFMKKVFQLEQLWENHLLSD